jgi:teichuronic acid exporter
MSSTRTAPMLVDTADEAALQVATELSPSLNSGEAISAGAPVGGTVLRGVVWLSAMRWAAQLLTWVSTLVIARLLAPEDYGLVAMATVLTGLLEVLSDIGIGAAVVQAKVLKQRDVEAAFGVTCIFGLVAAVALALSAPVWAHVQGEPRVIPIVRALSFAVFLSTVSAIPYSMLHRHLKFQLVARAQFARGLMTAGVTLGLAFVLRSHWALVIGYLAGWVSFSSMLMWAEPTRMRLPNQDTNVARLLRFGGLLTGERLLFFARSNTDKAVIGAVLGSRALGLYTMASALALLPLEKLGSAVAPVAYPTFSKLQDYPEELRRTFLSLTLATMAFAIPASVGMILTAPLLVPAIIGPQWNGAINALRVIAVFTPLIFHLGIVHPLLNSLGRVDLNVRVTIWTGVLTIPAMFVGVQGGVVGIALAMGLAVVVMGLYAEITACRLIGLRFRELLKVLAPVASASAGMALCLLAFESRLPKAWPAAPKLILSVVAGTLAYVGWALAFHRKTVLFHLKSARAAWAAR